MKYLTIIIALTVVTGFVVHAADRVSIYDIQYTTDPSGDSPYAGQTVTIIGYVTGTYFDGYFVAEEPDAWHAVYIYSNANGPSIGDEVELTGDVVEYYNMTEIQDVTDYSLLSTGNSINPTIVDSQTASQEKYESVLLTIEEVSVTDLISYNEWIIDDDSGGLICNDMHDYMYFPQENDFLDSVTGILFYAFGEFVLEPRNTSDIEGDVIPHYAVKGDIVTMNDSRDIIQDGYIEILGDQIISIGTSQPSGIQIVDIEGLIFPGLVDSHNHPRFNVLSEIPFPCKYTERYEWQDEPMYDDFWSQYGSILDYGGDDAQSDNLWKLAETRALCAGTTMIQGYNCNGSSAITIAHQGMGINNAERFPSKIYSSVFPLRYESDWRNNKRYQYWDRFVIHLCEGFSSGALQEFYTWQDWGMMDWRTTIIHGVPLGDAEWTIMADENMHLIWSPFSNMILYDQTADVPGALAAGVNVALAPDWTESGEDNMLAEMKYAEGINQDQFGGIITPQQFAEFVTCNAAYTIGAQDRVGSIKTGYQADLMVIPGDPGTPYQDLLVAEPADVKLTIVSGRPMYGDQEYMDQFAFVYPTEDILICDAPKKLAIQIDAHGIYGSDRQISEVMTDLQQAFDQSYPKLCDFISFDPCAGSTPPTPTPPGGPTYTPTPTPTSGPCDELGVEIWMPSNDFGPGDTCSLEARVCNPSGVTYLDTPLFVIMDVFGLYFYAPSFSDYDNYIIEELPQGIYVENVLDAFDWPEDSGEADGILIYGAMTNKSITQLFGNYDVFTFGWHE